MLDKWTQIDDEIWAKVIVFERNRRVAKAYARAPVLTVNGSDDGFDGMRWVVSASQNIAVRQWMIVGCFTDSRNKKLLSLCTLTSLTKQTKRRPAAVIMIIHRRYIYSTYFFPLHLFRSINRIGLCGFDNPMRDPKTEMLKQHIGQVK